MWWSVLSHGIFCAKQDYTIKCCQLKREKRVSFISLHRWAWDFFTEKNNCISPSISDHFSLTAAHWLCYPRFTRWKAILTACSLLHYLHCSSGSYTFEHCRAHRQTVVTLIAHICVTDRFWLCHLVFPDHVMHWLNIKALWKERIIWECSCGMQQNAMHGDGFYGFIQ